MRPAARMHHLRSADLIVGRIAVRLQKSLELSQKLSRSIPSTPQTEVEQHRFKHRIREVTLRAKGVSLETTIAELASYLRGWRSYFGFCETPYVLIQLTRWVRLRLRAAMWRQWKTPRRRRAALLELGVRPRLANNTAGSGLGPWYLARAKALSVGLSNAHFTSLGLPTLIDGC